MLLLIYISDFSDDLTTNIKLLPDDTTLFTMNHNVNTSTVNLNNNKIKIKKLGNSVKNEF